MWSRHIFLHFFTLKNAKQCGRLRAQLFFWLVANYEYSCIINRVHHFIADHKNCNISVNISYKNLNLSSYTNCIKVRQILEFHQNTGNICILHFQLIFTVHRSIAGLLKMPIKGRLAVVEKQRIVAGLIEGLLIEVLATEMKRATRTLATFIKNPNIKSRKYKSTRSNLSTGFL